MKTDSGILLQSGSYIPTYFFKYCRRVHTHYRPAANMSHILIKDNESPENELMFPLFDGDEEQFTLQDLQGAFPMATCLRYKDANDSQLHHVLCRDGKFCMPEGGWIKEGRQYIAVSQGDNQSRVQRFQEYRQNVARNRGQFSGYRRNQVARHDARKSTSVNLNIGIGCFTRGKFTRTAANSSRPGGIVTVGPFEVNTNTVSDITSAAFNKFRTQNINFRKAYISSTEFLLVYPDGTLVKNLPDCSTAFTIEGYRAFIDPKMKYDRLRLYLCQRVDYELNTNEVEIVTDSSTSSDDFDQNPTSSGIGSKSDENTRNENQNPGNSNSDNKRDDNKSNDESIEVRFEWNVHLLSKSFPLDACVRSLIEYLNESPERDATKSLALICDDKFLNPDDRVRPLALGKQNILNIVVEELSISHSDPTVEVGDNLVIRGKYDDPVSDANAQELVRRVISVLGNTTEPVAVVHEYARQFLVGRPLDVLREDEPVEGETSPIFVSRNSAFDDALEELKHQGNLRNPLEVTFFGEMAHDLGGPRREFLERMMATIKENLFQHHQEDNRITLVEGVELLSRKAYFFSGLLIGLSVLEGGPIPDFLDQAMSDTNESEFLDQFRKGMDRVGLATFIRRKPSLRFLFQPSQAKTLTVNKLLQIFKCNFHEVGSNDRQKEEQTYRLFVKYTREVFAGRRQPVTLGKILAFGTGCTSEPILGFAIRPEIEFVPGVIFATASTCINRLNLPLQGEYSEDQFFNFLDLAFTNEFFGME